MSLFNSNVQWPVPEFNTGRPMFSISNLGKIGLWYFSLERFSQKDELVPIIKDDVDYFLLTGLTYNQKWVKRKWLLRFFYWLTLTGLISLNILTVTEIVTQAMRGNGLKGGLPPAETISFAMKFSLDWFLCTSKINGKTPLDFYYEESERLSKIVAKEIDKAPNMRFTIGAFKRLCWGSHYFISRYLLIIACFCFVNHLGFTFYDLHYDIQTKNGTQEQKVYNPNLLRYYQYGLLDPTGPVSNVVSSIVFGIFWVYMAVTAMTNVEFIQMTQLNAVWFQTVIDIMQTIDLNPKDEASRRERLITVIGVHNDAIRFVKSLSGIYKWYIMRKLGSLFACVCLSMTLFVVDIDEPWIFKAYIFSGCMGVLLNLFLHCLFGENTRTYSGLLLTRLYQSCDWFTMNHENKKTFMIMQANMQIEYTIRPFGKNTELTLRAFANLLNTAYTAFTLLLTVME